jgi:S-methylmethionine-dependent homocysteine/selenocysteine methylase
MVFLTDSGLETDLVFHHGIDLPAFAAFPLLGGRQEGLLRDYFTSHATLAGDRGLGIVMETPTWRANSDWGAELSVDAAALASANTRAVTLVRECGGASSGQVVVSGCVGPRGDGYVADTSMTPEQARDYHSPQIATLAEAGADRVSALTLSYVAEAVGVCMAASRIGIPAVISFTVETNGRLPDGTGLGAAVDAVDAATGGSAAFFMVNCAHPDHVAQADVVWGERLKGIRANASRMSHAQLDASAVLDDGDPLELAVLLTDLHVRNPGVDVLGGCCGTDLRHIRALAAQLREQRPA